MASANIIQLNEVMESLRIDAEFYQEIHREIHREILNIEHVSFGEIIDVCKKGIFDIKAEKYSEEGIPFIRISNLKKGVIDDTNLAFIPQDIHDSEIKTEFRRNDIVLSKTAIPASSLINFEICNISQDIIGISLKPSSNDLLNEKYIVLFLNCKYGLLQMRRWFQGNIQMHLSLNDVKKILIPILPQEFQEKMENIFLDAQELMESSKVTYKEAEYILLDELDLLGYNYSKNTHYQSDLQNVLKFHRVDAQYFNPEYEKFLDAIKEYSNGFVNLLDMVENVNADFKPKQYPDENFSYVELSNINLSTGIIDGHSIIKGKNAPGRAKRLLKENDVIVSSVEGSLQKIAIVNSENEGSLASNGFFQFRSLESMLPEVILVLSKSIVIQKQMKRECTGTILTAVPPDYLNRIIIPLVREDKQEEIANLVRKSHRYRRKAYEFLDNAQKEIEEYISNLLS